MYPMRLRPGQEIKQCLQDFVIKQNLKAAFVLTCCGSLTQVTLRFAAKSNSEEGTVSSTNISQFLDNPNIDTLNIVFSSSAFKCTFCCIFR